jgi:Cu-processing system ATP-binding protein
MIAVRGLDKRFGAQVALRDVTLALRSGAVTALVGPNGSGKTTLIKILLGLTRADAGAFAFDGVPADADGHYRRSLGYMPQAGHYPEHLTIGEVLRLVDALRAGSPADDRLVRAFALDAILDKKVGVLSGGTRQKLSAAIAFRYEPRLLILDEPTAGLDPIASGILKDAIREARSQGRTVLITSHIMSELEEVAGDIAFLCDAQLRFSGAVPALLARTGQPRLEGAVAALMRQRPEHVASSADATSVTDDLAAVEPS